jgi:hypothetical protein
MSGWLKDTEIWMRAIDRGYPKPKPEKEINPMLYAIFYRTGGTLNYRWHRVFGLFNAEQAEQRRIELERMGYPVRMAPSTSVLARAA